MYPKKQKDIALRIYHQTESVTETIRILAYPIRRIFFPCIARENPPKNKERIPCIDNTPLEVKLNAIHRCYELGENMFQKTLGIVELVFINGENVI